MSNNIQTTIMTFSEWFICKYLLQNNTSELKVIVLNSKTNNIILSSYWQLQFKLYIVYYIYCFSFYSWNAVSYYLFSSGIICVNRNDTKFLGSRLWLCRRVAKMLPFNGNLYSLGILVGKGVKNNLLKVKCEIWAKAVI